MKIFKKNMQQSLKGKLTIVSCLFTLVGSLTASTVTYFELSPSIIQAEQEKAMTVANMTATYINASDFKKVSTNAENNIPKFNEMRQKFLNWNSKLDGGMLYAVTENVDAYRYVIYDTNSHDTQFSNQKDKFPVELKEVFETGEPAYTDVYYSDTIKAKCISAFTPIIANEKVIGVVVCEYNATAMTEKLDSIRITASMLALGTIFVMFLIIYAIMKRSFRPLNKLVDSLEDISRGDLTVKIERGKDVEIFKLSTAVDSTLYSFRGMLGEIINLVTEVFNNSQSITHGSEVSTQAIETVVSVTENVTNISQEQLKATDNTRKVLQRINEDSMKMSEQVAETLNLSHQTRTHAELGTEMMEDTSNQLNSISHSAQNTKETVVDLANQMEKVSGFIHTIAEIASQTNLLALNAAIEAARAGEQGRGFAIVAEEVRKLAGASQNATDEIRQIIKYLESHTEKITENLQINLSDVAVGREKLDKAIEVMKSIEKSNTTLEGSIKATNDIMDKIAKKSIVVNNSMELLANTSGQLDEVVTHLSTITQEQLAYSEEEKALALSLEQSAINLGKSIAQFRITTDNSVRERFGEDYVYRGNKRHEV